MREMVVSQAMPFPLCMPDAESVPFCVLNVIGTTEWKGSGLRD